MAFRHYLILFISFISALPMTAQMVIGEDTLAGNEWITYGQAYYKFTVNADGVYRIPEATLSAAGISGEAAGNKVRIYSMGRQVPLYVSTDGVFGPTDYIEFYGYKNRGEMDRHLFAKPDSNMLNPAHSMYTDKRVYYLTLEGSDQPSRVNTIPNEISNPPAPNTYYVHQEILTFDAVNNDPYYPLQEGGGISYSSYFHGEGFARSSETSGSFEISAAGRIPGQNAVLHLRLTSSNYLSHRFAVFFNGVAIDTLYLDNLSIADTSYVILADQLQDINQVSINNSNSLSRFALVSIGLTFPHTPTLGNAAESILSLDANASSQYYVFQDFTHGGLKPLLYTTDGKSRLVTDLTGSNEVEFLWPPLANQTTYRLAAEGSIKVISSLERKTFTDFAGDDTEYIVITHPDLMESGTESEYIKYRSSPEGGAYKAKAYSILDIYDQFGYGIEKHPQSIRNFVEFIHRSWPSAKMIFIVGRGIEYNRSRYENGTWENSFFVPTFGRPGADNLLAATLWDLVSRYPVGRLAITDQDGISTYLSKVKEHDLARFTGQSIDEKQWIKNVMHIGGGKSSDEQKDFEITLKYLGEELASSGYGADISFFQKQSTDVIGETESAQIVKLLNEGCGIINYLGHSSATLFEYNINDPSTWENKGRYPIFSAMGCSAGQIHGTVLSLSDNYVHLPDEGAIAFVSGSGSQFANALTAWARPWYDYFGNLQYGATLGESILYGLKAVSTFVDIQKETSNAYRYLLEQQTFQGDPALLLHPFPGPDYTIDPNSISFSPDVLNTKLDSFDISFSVLNIGRNLNQQLDYSIQIKLPDGETFDVRQDTFSALTYQTNITTRIPLVTGKKTGAFRLLITVDASSTIVELPAPAAENNNRLVDNLGAEGIEIFIVDDLITAAYPPDFSIVTTTSPEMVATGSNAFSKGLNVVFEIDTTPFFNSAALIREKFVDHSSTFTWSPQGNWTPGEVYYWRVSTDSLSPEQPFHWSKRSFLYQPGSFPGWNQSEFYQFTDNTFDRIIADSVNREFTFGSKSSNFNILNRFHDITQGLIPKVTIDGVIKAEFFTGFRNRNVQLFVSAIDSLTGDFMLNPNPGLYGSANHLSFDAPVFPYRADLPESRQALIDFVENIIPSGHHVFIYSYQQPLYPDYFQEQWAADETIYGKSIFSLIESQYPGSNIRSLESSDSKPFIVYFRKNRGGIEEKIAVDSASVISMIYDIKSSLTRGSQISQLAGPAAQWYSILSETIPASIDTAGDNRLSAIALSADFSDTLVISTRLLSQDTTIADIDASLYPYIQLTYTTEDSILYDPSDLVFWRVLYDGFAEVVLKPDLGLTFIDDTLSRGETMRLSTYVENVSATPIDTLEVSLRIINELNQTEELRTILTNLAPHSSLPVSFEKSTATYSGNYQVIMEANPNRKVKELNYSNNIGTLPMHVRIDDINPILDVTFDGYHIEDGDIVGANPLIRVQLHDENEFVRLEDTSLFVLFLEYPSDIEPQRIYFTTPWLTFMPAPPTGGNIAVIELGPDLFEDGIYTFQVQAKDGGGNVAGDNEYKISFEVINGRSVSAIYNFPNPFSSSTRFIYTMTGPGSPPFYKIEILSITGILVREITAEDMGPLPPGNHMTEYAWDGTDQNGNELAAGIYLYRLVVKDENNNDYGHYNPYGESDFKNKGWGKLVIVR
jgi:hypothetical protein